MNSEKNKIRFENSGRQHVVMDIRKITIHGIWIRCNTYRVIYCIQLRKPMQTTALLGVFEEISTFHRLDQSAGSL
jgi:hypothetical protein